MSDRADPAQVIARTHGAYVVAGRKYRTELPPELAPWHCYIEDGGHSIVVLLASTAADYDGQPGVDPAEYTVPAPVKAVLRAGWTVRDDGFVVTDLPYDSDLGLITEPGDDELDAHTPTDTGLHRYAVGELYHPTTTRWPEGVSTRLTDTGVDLVLFFGSPARSEVDAVREGQAGFALIAGQHALLLAYRFAPGIPWSDSPWQACRQREPTGLPPVGKQGQLLVSVILVDSDTGLIRALRQTSWAKNFVDAVRQAIRTQVLNKSTDEQGAAEIDGWYRRYRTTADLVRNADLTTKG